MTFGGICFKMDNLQRKGDIELDVSQSFYAKREGWVGPKYTNICTDHNLAPQDRKCTQGKISICSPKIVPMTGNSPGEFPPSDDPKRALLPSKTSPLL